MYRLLPAALAAVFVLGLLAACGGGSQSKLLATGSEVPAAVEGAAKPGGDPAAAGLPVLPGGDILARQVQDTGSYVFSEPDVHASELASFSGNELTLEQTGMSWAILGANGGGAIPSKLYVDGDCDGLYIGVSDYGSGRWHWLNTEAYTTSAPFEIDLPDGQRTSGAGNFYFAAICPDGSQAAVTLSVDLDTGEDWNLLVWVAADNNLAEDAVSDLNEMEAVGSTDNVRVLAGYDIDVTYLSEPVAGTDQVHFIKVVQDTNPLSINTTGDPANQSFPRAGYNSADTVNIEAFLDWADANFPASHTMLVIWNHGDGWLPGSDGKAATAIMYDDSDGPWDMTDNTVVAAALAGRGLDILGFDACNMAQVEALYDYRAAADYFVASQALEPNAGWEYSGWLTAWNANFPCTPQEIDGYAVDAFTQYYTANPEEACLSALDGAALDQLYTGLHDLAALVTPAAETERAAFQQAVAAAFEPDDSDGGRDLGGFLEAYAGLSENAQIQTQATTLLQLVNSSCVTAFDQVQLPDCSGLCVWLPTADQFIPFYTDDYALLGFNTATGWLPMLEAIGAPVGTDDPPRLRWEPGYKVVVTFGDPGYSANPAISDPDGNYGTPEFTDDLDGIIQFSQDSSASGVAEESAELLPGATVGEYYVDIVSSEATAITMAVQLLDDADALVYDFGSFELGGGGAESTFVAGLFYNDGSIGEHSWEPGDYIMVSWGDVDAEFDLYIESPNGGFGYCYDSYGLDGIIEFSLDSLDSGVTLETAKLLPAGPSGIYPVWAEFYDYYGTPPATVDVYVELFDSSDTLKHDFGTISFSGSEDIFSAKHLAVLNR